MFDSLGVPLRELHHLHWSQINPAELGRVSCRLNKKHIVKHMWFIHFLSNLAQTLKKRFINCHTFSKLRKRRVAEKNTWATFIICPTGSLRLTSFRIIFYTFFGSIRLRSWVWFFSRLLTATNLWYGSASLNVIDFLVIRKFNKTSPRVTWEQGSKTRYTILNQIEENTFSRE